MKAVTAAASLLTAGLLWLQLPRLLAIPTPTQFRQVSDRLTDETSRHERTVAQLRRTEEIFRLLVDGMTDYAVCMLDLAGCVTTWNAGAARIMGYPADQIIGRHFSLFFTQEERDAGVPLKALETALRDRRYEAEAWRLRQDGSRFWANVVIDPIYDSDGDLVGVAMITRDITQRRQTEETLEQTRAALAQAQKMEAVGQLTGGIAHDFNNLLTSILGSLELLERGSDRLSDEARRFIGVIRHAGERGAELTRGLLAFSRKQTLAPAPVDVNRLVGAMSELLHRTLGEAVMVNPVLAAEAWPVFIDRNQLENALLNLAVNARDAMPEGGKLTIETGNTYLDEDYCARHGDLRPGDYVVVSVADTGIGMSDEVMSRVFEPFYTTKPVGSGTGLGLSQVYGFVKQSGGHIKLDSEPGVGTTIRLYLPRYWGQIATDEAAASDADSALQPGNEIVLVVEDDPGVRAYSVSAARELGYTVLEAHDGPSALAMLERVPAISLMFTDVGLPGMDGRRLAEEARRRVPRLRVVFTSGYARDAIMQHGLLTRSVLLLPKPFTVEDLSRILREALDEA
jgi:PAS domain S-box-containing protein